MVNDMRGHLSELLAKAIDQHALDWQVPRDELAAVRQFLVPYGQLDDKGRYVPIGSSGYSVEGGGYNQAPVPLPPLSFRQLAPSPAVVLPYLFEHISNMQPTMLQPVGGMDGIARAIYEQVKPAVRLRAPVSAIRRGSDRVRIEHGPARQSTEADYCICTLPMPILARIPNDFSAAKKAALAATPYLHSVKLAFEASRFWETEGNIYGGARLDRPAQRKCAVSIGSVRRAERYYRRLLLRRLDSTGKSGRLCRPVA
jgi:monoamine oxidase